MADLRLCIICGQSRTATELQTCSRCLAKTRRDLARIGALYAYLPALLGQPDGAHSGGVMGGYTDEAALPGGDILVMLGPGSDGGEGRPDDAPAVAWELATWCQDWAEIRGETQPYAHVHVMSGWLSQRAGWALSYHLAADEFVSDLRRILGRLEDATATSDRPERGAPCFECGALLERGWTSHGRDETWRCPRCHRAYDEVAYRLTVRAQYEAARTSPGH